MPHIHMMTVKYEYMVSIKKGQCISYNKITYLVVDDMVKVLSLTTDLYLSYIFVKYYKLYLGQNHFFQVHLLLGFCSWHRQDVIQPVHHLCSLKHFTNVCNYTWSLRCIPSWEAFLTFWQYTKKWKTIKFANKNVKTTCSWLFIRILFKVVYMLLKFCFFNCVLHLFMRLCFYTTISLLQ